MAHGQDRLTVRLYEGGRYAQCWCYGSVGWRSKLPWGLASHEDSHRYRVGRHEDLPTGATYQRRIERTFSKGNEIGNEHCSELALDTIAAISSVQK